MFTTRETHLVRMQEEYEVFMQTKELSFCHKLWFSNPVIFATRYCRSLIFQTMNCASYSLSLKYQWFTPSGCKDIRIRIFEFVTKTQFLFLFYILQKRKRNLLMCRILENCWLNLILEGIIDLILCLKFA